MKPLLVKILKILLIVFIILLTVLLVMGIVLSLDWPWWVGAFMLAGLFGLFLVMLMLKRLLARQREKRFVGQVVAQNESYINSVDLKEAESLRELQGRWKEAVDALKSSHLKRFGNPLYVLPWYMIIGESGSGKTTAIKSARLSSPFAEVTHTSGLSGTRNCDWWFFEQAVIIDTAGRYAVPVDEGRDKDEWHKFLGLLTKYRKKEPINGLVVTIGSDRLRDANLEVLTQIGRSIRQRIDELMRMLGASFPIYVLVTKCDLIQGMTDFCDSLDQKALEQAVGLVNKSPGTTASGFLETTLKTVADRLRDLRLILLHKPLSQGFAPGPATARPPGLILFPDEFEHLKPALNAFFSGCFQENPYQETPVLRGLFFSSGRQEGSPYSHFLNALGLIEQREVLPGTDKGLFLHDLFSKILPRDRGLFAPTHRTLKWGRLTRNIGLTAWVTLVVALCGLLSFSFVKNLQIIRGISREFSAPPVLEGDILTILDRMEQYRQAIVRVEKANRGWWIPRFGLNQSLEVEQHLKQSYADKYKNELLAYYDNRLEAEMSRLATAMPNDLIGRYTAHLARRINLLKARLAQEHPATLINMAQPSYDPELLMADESLAMEIDQYFSGLNHHYLLWSRDPQGLTLEMRTLQTWLQYTLSIRKTSINWLVDWANAHPDLSYIELEDFWGDHLLNPDKITIPPAFTDAGQQLIQTLVGQIEEALADLMTIVQKKPAFKKWYLTAYAKVWHDFGEAFPRGEYWLANRASWQHTAMKITTDEGPYFSLLDKMALELKALDDEAQAPPWVRLIQELRSARLGAMGTKVVKQVGALEKAVQKGKSLLAKSDKVADDSTAQKRISTHLVAAKAYREYRDALSAITLAAESRQVAYELTVEYFSEDPATSKTAFFAAMKALKRLRASLEGGFAEQEMFWRLVTGPLYFMRDYVNLESACYLNELWDQDVLVEIRSMTDKTQINQRLFGPDGYGVKFVKGPAAPFLSRSLDKGYYARETLDRRLPFTDDFLFFLTRSTEISKFKPTFDRDLASVPEAPTDYQTEELLKLLLMKERGQTRMPASFELPSTEPEVAPPPVPPPVKLAQSYPVDVKCLPTDVNAGALIKPHATILEMKCGQNSTRLVNLNYPRRATFNWIPKSCQSLVLTIDIGSLELIREYTGERAFLQFLEDFSDGKHTFALADFGNKGAPLSGQGVKYFKLSYQFEGHEPLIEILDREKTRAKKIAEARKAYEKRKAAATRKAAQDQRKQQAEVMDRLKKELAAQQANQTKSIKQILEDWEARKALKEMRERQTREALKARKQQLALEAKQAWEASIPDVPKDIVSCWDQ